MDTIKEEQLDIKVEETQETYIIQEVQLDFAESIFDGSIEIKDEPRYENDFGASSTNIKEEPISRINQIESKSNVITALESSFKRYKNANSELSRTPNISVKRREISTYSIKPTYQCTHCSFQTFTSRYLELHVENHHSIVRIRSCLFCKFKTEDIDMLKEHIAEQHNVKVNEVSSNKQKNIQTLDPQIKVEPVLKCDRCDFTTIEECKLESHKCNQEILSKCKFCSYEAADKQDFTKHMRTHEQNILYKCPRCTFVTRFPETLNQHERNHLLVQTMKNSRQPVSSSPQKPKYRCRECPYIANTAEDLVQHEKDRHFKIKKRSCMFCKFQTQIIEDLRQHIEQEHKVKVNDAAIQDRGGRYWNHKGQQRNTHQKLQPENVFKCSSCNCTFLEKCKLDAHKKFCRKTHVISPLVCKICNYKTNVKKDFGKHMETHLKSYKCPYCYYTTVLKQNFDLHVLHHNTTYRCDHCPFTTHSKPAMIPHLQSHIREKQAFEQKVNRRKFMMLGKNHQNKHMMRSNKILRCSVCHYQTNYKIKLDHHLKHHDKMFKCYHCQFSTKRKNFLIKHIKTHLQEIDLIQTRDEISYEKLEIKIEKFER